MVDAEDLLICHTCGTQFDDPRQFVPPTGQKWTSMAELRRGKYENKWEQDAEEKGMWSIWTEPKFAIGQRAILIETPEGNVLWDLITYLDSKTIDFINSRGPLRAIVISHPHYYTTHLEWARAFNNIPIYTSIEDIAWFNRADFPPSTSSFPVRRLISQTTETILPGVTAIKTGGHFPGSLVLLWKKHLMIADTFVTVPSGLYHHDRPPGTTSYSFMWSIPNMIPLSPPEIHAMWKAVAPYEWESTHGAFTGMDIRRKDCKNAVLESMKIQVKYEGHANHALLSEDC
ncbi:hypothetical protein SLS54_000319 [Diplodia seriata]